MRTLPDSQKLLRPLEDALMSSFVPYITGHRCNPTERQVIELPTRAGELGIINPCTEASVSYEASKRISAPLARQIIAQKWQLPDEDQVKKIKSDVERIGRPFRNCITFLTKSNGTIPRKRFVKFAQRNTPEKNGLRSEQKRIP